MNQTGLRCVLPARTTLNEEAHVSRRTLATSGGLVAALVLAAGAVTLLPGAAPPAAADALVPYTGCGELLEHYRSELARQATAYGSGYGPLVSQDSAVAAPASPVAATARARGDEVGAVGSGPTGTNLQERGVDEPDTAKTVDGHLYVVARNRLQVLSAGASPELLGSLPLGESAYGAELLVQGDRVLILVPGGWAYARPAVDLAWPMASSPVGGGSGATRLLLVDVADPRDPRVLEELELSGRYLSARLSDGAVRVVTSATPVPRGTSPQPPYGPAQERAALSANVRAARSASLADVLPRTVRRAADGRVLTEGPAVGCRDVRYAPSTQGASTLVVTTLDPARDLQPSDTTAVTTDGELVYASGDRLYVATSRWGTSGPVEPVDDETSTAPGTPTATVAEQVTTELHAFDVSSPTSTSYAGSASVGGYVMGRWALSSYDGHLRVATTSSPPWGQGPPSASRVTVLAEQPDGLVETGRVDGLGIGERIYAVRYFGTLATVVTFRQTDPLYVLDLADPSAPRLLGELKVPGFSTYLHPVGGDRLLGVGQDADSQGQVTGIQLSLFDLSDRSRPVQLDRMSLGQGYTQAADDSRAFGFDVVRGTALLPLATYTQTGGTSSALAVRVTDEGTLAPAGRLEVGLRTQVERVLHDADHVYAVTQEGVVAASADGLRRTGSVAFAG